MILDKITQQNIYLYTVHDQSIGHTAKYLPIHST
jgi:hypothetical protein